MSDLLLTEEDWARLRERLRRVTVRIAREMQTKRLDPEAERILNENRPELYLK